MSGAGAILVGDAHPLTAALGVRLGDADAVPYAAPATPPRAAALVLLAPPWLQDPDDIGAVVDDLDVAYRWLHAWVPYVRERGQGGALLYVLSLDGIYGTAAQLLLAERDSALLAQARAMALELGRYGVRSNILALGPLAAVAAAPGTQPEALVANPLRRAGTWADAAATAAFLLGDQAAHLSGQLLVCAGGADIGRAPV